MTAYSFGARWVGVVAMREPPPPEPIHKMSLRLRKQSNSRSVHIEGVDIPADEVIRQLARIRVREGLAGRAARARECLVAERSIRAGRAPKLRAWLLRRLQEPASASPPTVLSTGGPKPPATPRVQVGTQRTAERDRIVATGWATGYPQAPDSPWLPPLNPPLVVAVRDLGLELDDEGFRWLRWANLHSSYLYESVSNSPLSQGVLEILAMLGRGWMRLAMLDRARAQLGEFDSSDAVSKVLAADQHARTALAAWATNVGAGLYGKGEASVHASGRPTTSREVVATQLLGALSLVYASQRPADLLLKAVNYQAPAPEPDWLHVIVNQLKVQPNFERRDEGPDHDKTFTVTVRASGRSASASAGSAKSARKAALREFVKCHLPHALPKPVARVTPPRPRAYQARLPAHTQAVMWAQHAFELNDVGLLAQALTHRSWAYENRALVSAANQRDYGTLAAEGSEILTHLVRHQHALQLLNASFEIPVGRTTSPNVTGESVVELFDAMPIADGVLRSRGLSELGKDLREDVAQAIAAASWRANGDLMAERQPAVVSRWVRSFTPPADPTTQLQEYCSRAKVNFDFDFERRGPDHLQEYRATVTFDVAGSPSWVGEWRAGKTPAKQSASAGALSLLLAEARQQSVPSGQDAAIIRGVFLAELRAIDPRNVSPAKEIANGTLGVDLLAVGDYQAYDAWSKNRSFLLPSTDSAVARRLTDYYETVLSLQLRDAVAQWIVQHTPARGGPSTDPAERIRAWWTGAEPSLLVLAENLLTELRKTDPGEAILTFVETQARAVAAVADARVEADRVDDETARTLAIRIGGAEFSDAFEPVVALVELAGVGASWAREPQAIFMTVPRSPTATNPICAAAANALTAVSNDPWLADVQTALTSFLSITERLFATSDEPTAAAMDELSLAELTLTLQLQANDEDDH